MATLREKRPGVWEVRVFTGTRLDGRPTQLSKTVHGGKRDAQRVAAELEVGPGRASPGGRSVSDVLDAWVEQNLDTWAPSSARDQQSRVRGIKKDPIARLPLARLSVGDVERWHTRLRADGHGATPASRTSTACCGPRWRRRSGGAGRAPTSASMARLRSTKTQRRTVMTLDEVRAVMAAAATIDPAAALAAAARRGLRRPPGRAGRAAVDRSARRDADDRLGDRDRLERATAAASSATRRPRPPTPAPSPSTPTPSPPSRRLRREARAVRPVDVRPRPRARQPRPDRVVVEASPHDRRHRRRSGGCTTSATGRPPSPSARATTSAPSPAASATPTRR